MMRVLYAEDDPQVAEMVRLNFTRHGGDWALEIVDSGRRWNPAAMPCSWSI